MHAARLKAEREASVVRKKAKEQCRDLLASGTFFYAANPLQVTQLA